MWLTKLSELAMAFTCRAVNLGFGNAAERGGDKGSGNLIRSSTDAHSALTQALGLSNSDSTTERRVRAAQFNGVCQLLPFFLGAQVAAGLVIIYSAHDLFSSAFMVGWGSFQLLCFGWLAFVWWRSSPSAVGSLARKDLSYFVRCAQASGLAWSLLPIASTAAAGQVNQSVLTAAMVGLLCAGGFCLSVVPNAALPWVVMIGLSTSTALAFEGAASNYLLAVFALGLTVLCAAAVLSSACAFVSNTLNEAELEQRGDLIALLLNEFEEKRSAWIWEADTRGFFRRVNDRFLMVSGCSRVELEAKRMIDLACSCSSEKATAAAKLLEDALAQKTVLRDLEICVNVNGDVRWWAVSASPVTDEYGYFSGHQGVASDITEAKRVNELVTHMAEHDSLTGIRNRSWFLARAKRRLGVDELLSANYPVLFLIDLDNFKVVNDTSGHPAGDELLKMVANRFQAVCGDSVDLARFGGDEFAAMGLFGSPETATHFAEKLITAASAPFSIGGRDFGIGATIGFAQAPADGVRIDDLLRKADIALYKAKQVGRGRVLAFEACMEREVLERRAIERDLHEAVSEGQLGLQFQPIVDARSEKVVSNEVLVRWQHPVRGEVPPDVFVPVAEHAGLILPIGEWVLRRACQAYADLPEAGAVSVNLSPVQFISPNLVEMVASTLRQTGFPPERLILEITESVFIRDFGSAGKILSALKGLGVKVALDDFGTGYSSLSYLRQYKFDRIKIDKSFVEEIGERSEGLAIISAVIALAHNLGIEVTAEGVEAKFQAEALRTLGCDALQGFYFGKPSDIPVIGKLPGGAPERELDAAFEAEDQAEAFRLQQIASSLNVTSISGWQKDRK
ncbi:PAS domain S-box-containing protein/diguanylate cyclase (GGDEF)-like protein [Roseibium hamelinense]|uniref:PAS domain S-box-containing protein/diguanylate cyclase (GGDEF)-like protein n=2 Tax=Roseibium hamelinense TaxID=150831 RepID=A0A562SV98_9HYPH|nr:PAS domain S-box-containing protein/diguanylate cyclase (GGDEF)-like protein [Roseibium hamelinense]